MPTEKKAGTIETVSEKLGRAKAVVITDYRGLTVAQLEDLRRKLRAASVDYLVVKNTLARRAAEANGLDDLKAALVGPSALAIGYDDPTLPARMVNDYIKATRRLSIMSGLLGKQVINADGVRQLADLPSREVLLGQLAGSLNHSVAQLASAMNSVVQKLANGLDAYRRKLEGAV
ncbi:MAG: 50S ribosomal protein L10 [Candidatus Dormibacteria bacterium]